MRLLSLFICLIGFNVAICQEYPFLEDFEETDGGWTVSGENPSWEWGEPQAAGINSSNDGVNAWVTNLDGDMNSNEISYLTSPSYDISALSLPEVSFYLKQRGLESLKFEFSTNGGATFETINSFSPNLISSIYSEHSYRLYEAVGKSTVIFRFALINESRSSEGVGFDTFGLQESPEDELSVIGHSNKRHGILKSNEVLNIQLRNNGSNELRDFAVNAEIYFGEELIAERTANVSSIAIGETIEQYFADPVDMGQTGVYFVKLYHSYENDVIDIDDTLSYYAHHFNSIPGLPYSEDFESFPDTSYTGNEFADLPGWNSFFVDYPVDLVIGNQSGLTTNKYLRFNADFGDPGEYPTLNIDLSSYDLSDNIYVDFSTFTEGRDIFDLRFQSSDESPTIFLRHFSFEEKEMWIDSHINLTELVSEAGGTFSSSSRLIFETTFIPTDFAIVDNIRVYEEVDKPVSLSFVDFNPGLFQQEAFKIYGNQELSESYIVNVEIMHDGGVNTYDTTVHQDSILQNGTLIDFETAYFVESGEYSVQLMLSPESQPSQFIDSLNFSFFKYESSKPDLPLYLDFESLDPIDYTSSSFEVEGLPGFSFKMNGTYQTALRINENLGFESKRSVSVASGHDLTWTLDLSEYDTTTDLSLDLTLLPNLFIWREEDDIKIRGSVDDSWITLDRFYEVTGFIKDDSSNYYAHWRKLNKQFRLTDYLKENGQNYSNTTQIQFSGPDYGQYLVYDNVAIFETYSNNLRLWDVISPNSFLDTLQDSTFVVRVLNMGEEDITELAIAMEYLNEELPIETIEFTGLSIAPQDSMDFEISNPFDFSMDGRHDVKISAISSQDEYPYDNEYTARIYNRTITKTFPYSFNRDSLDFSDTLNIYGEFEGLPGYFFHSDLDIAYMGAADITWDDVPYDVIQGNNHAAAVSNQDHIWTFDLSEFQIEKDIVEFQFEYFLRRYAPDYLETDGIYVRGSVEDDWIPAFLHIDPINGNSYRTVDEEFNLNEILTDSSQNFSSTSQIKIDLRVSYWSTTLSLLNFQLSVEIGEEPDDDNDSDLIISAEDEITFNLYPNPNTGLLYIDAFENVVSLEIFSLSGQKVKLINNVMWENDISELDAGLFNVSITTSTGENRNYLLVVE